MSEERTLSADTSFVAERLQFDVWRRMTPIQKFAAFLDLQATAIALAEAGIRLRHPAADAREVFCAGPRRCSIDRRCCASMDGIRTRTDEIVPVR